MPDDATAAIRRLNDSFRQSFSGGRVAVTAGVNSLAAAVKAQVLERVRSFSDFSSDNDPDGEHDFGNFEIGGQRFFWKIDYYDANLEFGSDDPADESKTTRVLTVMLAEEY